MAVKAAAKNSRVVAAGVKGLLPDFSWYVAAGPERFSLIKKLCERIAREFKPEKIILFGSQAYGCPTEDSDIDLLVVMPYSGSPLQKPATSSAGFRFGCPWI